MIRTILSLSLVTMFSSVSFATTQVEGTSKYIVEAKLVVIEGKSAIDLFNALNSDIEYVDGRRLIKAKDNVKCFAEYLTPHGEPAVIHDASCTVRLNSSTVISE
ncbi:hypothetical protein [Bdellovibrio sp. GT3]|uniref:hypothetical protein n=1 Tax=Bdellovibrio sp. GT3 TaxID=3136282 RepID=UPI0030F22D4E